MSSKDKNEKKNEREKGNENETENENNDDETMSQNEENEIIRGKNDILDEAIDKSKSFEEQIESLKKREDLKEFWRYNNFGDKELKSKYFKIELADMSYDIDKKLFEQIKHSNTCDIALKRIRKYSGKKQKTLQKKKNKNKKHFLKVKQVSLLLKSLHVIELNVVYYQKP